MRFVFSAPRMPAPTIAVSDASAVATVVSAKYRCQPKRRELIWLPRRLWKRPLLSSLPRHRRRPRPIRRPNPRRNLSQPGRRLKTTR